MTHTVLIANPAASQFTGALHRTILRVISAKGEVEPLWPQSASHARTLAAEAAQRRADMVVAVGGDGIVHQVAQSLIGTETALGIIPAGTTNVLARILGIPSKPAVAAKLLADGSEPVPHPALELDAITDRGGFRAWSLFSLGVGTDAIIVEEAEKEPYRKYRFGAIHYARTAVGTVWRDIRKQRPMLAVDVGEQNHAAIGVLVQFQPVYTYFGRFPMRIGPELPDPLTVLTIHQLPIRRAGAVLRGALRSGLGDVKGMTVTTGVSEVRIHAAEPTPIQADGESLDRVTSLRAAYRPDALLIARPQSPR